ncbi:MAG: GDP-mannose 4,6-dehydratase, partial [Rhodobacter sp.]|nr:GDP-mannose 4,6-dehydratase [Rhodobacter sp.]
ELLLGDPSKAERELGWKREVSFKDLVAGMVRYDLQNDGYGGDE